jgi:hypothetical protein
MEPSSVFYIAQTKDVAKTETDSKTDANAKLMRMLKMRLRKVCRRSNTYMCITFLPISHRSIGLIRASVCPDHNGDVSETV